MDENLALLHQKIDHLTEQLEAQRRRQQVWDDLFNDLAPVGNHLVKLTIDELAEIGSDFELQDLLFLVKRLLRNSRSLLLLLDRLEALMGISDEVQLLGKQAFTTVVENLDRMEREGYFTFARESWRIFEKIVNEFSVEDMQALGDSIVPLRSTLRKLTQPEFLMLADRSLEALQAPNGDDKTVSMLALLRELSDPDVRKGLFRLLNVVKVFSEETNQIKNRTETLEERQ
ncbi:MAG: DUF1641 domain-containing protein [Anaerolineales bacterium]|jgi:uncharacterized protein YjgD (DUF1641 family)